MNKTSLFSFCLIVSFSSLLLAQDNYDLFELRVKAGMDFNTEETGYDTNTFSAAGEIVYWFWPTIGFAAELQYSQLKDEREYISEYWGDGSEEIESQMYQTNISAYKRFFFPDSDNYGFLGGGIFFRSENQTTTATTSVVGNRQDDFSYGGWRMTGGVYFNRIVVQAGYSRATDPIMGFVTFSMANFSLGYTF